MPDASDNLVLIGVAGYSKGGSFQRMILAPKDTFNKLLREQLFSSLFFEICQLPSSQLCSCHICPWRLL